MATRILNLKSERILWVLYVILGKVDDIKL